MSTVPDGRRYGTRSYFLFVIVCYIMSRFLHFYNTGSSEFTISAQAWLGEDLSQ